MNGISALMPQLISYFAHPETGGTLAIADEVPKSSV